MHDREESRSDNESGVGVGGGRLKRHPLQPEAEGRNQIETADHVADAAIVLSAIIFPVWKVPDGSLFRGRAFLPELAQLFELFCLIFAVTFYFSDLYYEIAKKQRKVGIVAVLGSSVL